MRISDQEYIRLFGSLNENQNRALRTSNNSLLQVIAGPGTGKTKLLVSRVAYLLIECRLPSSGIIVTTFTKKAANEMKERLEKLLENYNDLNLQRLQIGTFHSLCFGYLKYYGRSVGLDKFTIADDKDQKDLLLKALNSLDLDDIKSDKSSIKRVQSYISKQKSLGFHPENVIISDPSDVIEKQKFQVYSKYQDLLHRNGLIDFDDILVFTYKLLTIRPECAAHVKHILVDEFQDTNTIQLKLIFKFSRYCNDNITIVGDADQSIYGFRNAEYENFKTIETIANNNKRDLIKVTLDQNYRSTSSILNFSECVMRNQKGREEKSLISNNTLKYPVYYIHHTLPSDEPIFIADQISTLLKQDDNNYTFRDFAIIVRVSRTFLSLEKELTRKGILYKIVKGHSFWELKEISMTIDCLRIIANDDWLAYKRVIGWFATGCGNKLIEKIESEIYNKEPRNSNVSVFSILGEFANGKRAGAMAKARNSLTELLNLIEQGKSRLLTCGHCDFFSFILQSFDIIEYSIRKKSTKKDEDEVRYDIIENLSELRTQFENYNPEEDELLRRAQEEIFKLQDQTSLKGSLTPATNYKNEGGNLKTESDCKTLSNLHFLTKFLDHIYLAESVASDKGEEQKEEKNKLGRVTLTTIHGSKGLEWSVVFLPSLVNNIIPSRFSLSEPNPEQKESSINEERRCFYVALTRAKDQLFLSTYSSDSDNAYQAVSPSLFFNEISKDTYYDISPACNNSAGFCNSATNGLHKTGVKVARSKENFGISTWEKRRAIPLYSPKQTPQPVGKNGIIYNPVTGAAIDAKGVVKKRKRLGMGRPLKQLIPSRKI